MLLTSMASEPIDILWRNMGGTRGVYLFRRIFLYVLGVVIIVFVSTPTAILSTIQYVDYFDIFELTWFEHLPYGQFIMQHAPPLVILGVN